MGSAVLSAGTSSSGAGNDVNVTASSLTLTINGKEQKLADARFRIDVFLLTNPATPDLLLLAYRIAQVQKDAIAQQRYGIRLSQEFPNSDQAHALAASKINPG